MGSRAQRLVDAPGTSGDWEPTYDVNEDGDWVVVGWNRPAAADCVERDKIVTNDETTG
jgi:hypothetical protein